MIRQMHQKRLQRILAGLWHFRTVYQIVITLFPVIDRGWSLAELGTETVWQERLWCILAGLQRFCAVCQIIVIPFAVVGREWSLAELDTETLLNCESLAELNAEMSLSGRAAGLLNHGISPLSKSAQNAPESFLVVIRQEYAQLGQERLWRILAGLCNLPRGVFA